MDSTKMFAQSLNAAIIRARERRKASTQPNTVAGNCTLHGAVVLSTLETEPVCPVCFKQIEIRERYFRPIV